MLVLVLLLAIACGQTDGFVHSRFPNMRRVARTMPMPEISRISHGRTSTSLNGIPKLFRWLVDLYPQVIEDIDSKTGTDYFYLDMNGIIHSCTHGNADYLVTVTETEMFQRIFLFTDRLIKMVNPTKMIFLGVDGVAPRAKMNQQRARRFKASKEREIMQADHFSKVGSLPISFDSNCITPGTEFMDRLSTAFKGWIEHQQQEDEFWRTGATVIFSGPDVPGEGEHKAMDFIRSLQANDSSYRPKERHCMYGLDADLIMLSLATHEEHFTLLREKTTVRKRDSLSLLPEDFELLEVAVLREMISKYFTPEPDGDSMHTLRSVEKRFSRKDWEEFTAVDNSIATAVLGESKEHGYDVNRLVDDFIFLCFFVGNDFLPSLPHLDISDGSLNMLMDTYRQMLPALRGHLTNGEKIHLPRLELFLQEIARREPLYFEQRAADDHEPTYGTADYKACYYQNKLEIEHLVPQVKESEDKELQVLLGSRAVVGSYLEGLLWVLQYYHTGCKSWTWYYPHLYGPCASDFKNLPDLQPAFSTGQPFTPLLQLLSVLPPQSGHLLPKAYSELMTSQTSPLSTYYPSNFQVDGNGKRNAWECVVQIPFLPEAELVATVNAIDHMGELTEGERGRNMHGVIERFDPPAADTKRSKKVKKGRWANAFKTE